MSSFGAADAKTDVNPVFSAVLGSNSVRFRAATFSAMLRTTTV